MGRPEVPLKMSLVTNMWFELNYSVCIAISAYAHPRDKNTYTIATVSQECISITAENPWDNLNEFFLKLKKYFIWA